MSHVHYSGRIPASRTTRLHLTVSQALRLGNSCAVPQLRFGIGIHGGEVVAGVIGTGGLSKFSVTGDPINVASRVEGLTSNFQVDLLITEEIRRSLDERFVLRAMPPVQVKGKALPIQTYYVENCAEPPQPSLAGTLRPSA